MNDAILFTSCGDYKRDSPIRAHISDLYDLIGAVHDGDLGAAQACVSRLRRTSNIDVRACVQKYRLCRDQAGDAVSPAPSADSAIIGGINLIKTYEATV